MWLFDLYVFLGKNVGWAPFCTTVNRKGKEEILKFYHYLPGINLESLD